MLIEKDYKIEKLVSKDQTRENIAGAYIEVGMESSSLVATNGHALAIVPINVSGEIETGNPKGFTVDTDTIKAIRRNGGSGYFSEDSVIVGSTSHKLGGQGESGKFPDYKQLLPDPETCKFRILTINPRLLLDLAEAIGSKGQVTLSLPEDPLLPILVTSEMSPKANGVIMPMRNPKERSN